MLCSTRSSTSEFSFTPATGRLLIAHSFFGGNLIFRGHFNASGNETGINLTVMGGFGFAYSAFLNGQFLGSGQGNSTVAELTNVWDVTEDMLKIGEDNVLTVIQGTIISSRVHIFIC